MIWTVRKQLTSDLPALSDKADPTLWHEERLGPDVTEQTDGLLSLLFGTLLFDVL